MSMEQARLCWGCMSALEESATVCPRCGYRNGQPAGSEFLRPGVVIAKRYLVGKLLSHNGEGAVYMGYDQEEERKVWIAEYMPDTLSKRNESTGVVMPKTGREAQYKSLLYDVIENTQILRTIPQKSMGGLVPVLDLVSGNGTAYTIYRQIEGTPLYDYLKTSGGELSWPKAKPMVLPLFKCISALHAQGAIHRGIAPENMLVDSKGGLWLFGFGLAPLRTGMSELSCELFEGYSAPEQYSATGQQGVWTDTYGCAAVLYRMLTGTMPISAEIRKERDSLYPANMLNPLVPDNVSSAIDGAMLVNAEKRTASPDTLVAELLEEKNSNTAVFDSSAMQTAVLGMDSDVDLQKKLAVVKRQKGGVSRQGKIPPWLRVMIITSALLLVALILVYVLWLGPALAPPEESQSSEPPLTTEANSEPEQVPADDTLVPNFMNQFAQAILENPEYQARFYFTTVEEYSDENVPKGVVMAQSTPAGTPMPNKGTIQLTVSKGPRTAVMPYLLGSTVGLATRTLDEMDVRYEIVKEKVENAESGLILKASHEAGDLVLRENDVVLLTIKDDAPPPEESSAVEEEETQS